MKKMMDAAIKAETVAKADLDKMLAEHSIALPEDLKVRMRRCLVRYPKAFPLTKPPHPPTKAKIIDWKLH